MLTGAQSVVLNVYLARMDMSPEELVGYLEEGDDIKIGLSGLRYLISVLPSHEEVSDNGSVFCRECCVMLLSTSF